MFRIRARHGDRPGRPRVDRPASKPSRRSRPGTEPLEDRRVPAVLFDPVFGPEVVLPLNGPRVNSPAINLIFADKQIGATGNTFWGNAWNQWYNPASTVVSQQVISMINSPYFHGLTRSPYGTNGQVSFGGSYIDPNPLPDGFSTSQIHDLIEDAAKNALGHNPNNIYVVVTAPGMGSGQSDNPGGYNTTDDLHEVWVGVQQGSVAYGSPVLDKATVTLSHEVVENMTDPVSHTGIYVIPPPNAPNASAADAHQIADYEPNLRGYNYRVNGVLDQAFWSMGDGAFVVNDGNTQNFHVHGGIGGTLVVDGDQEKNVSDAILVDTSPAGGVTVTMNGETVTFDPGQIGSITLKPRLASNQGPNQITIKSTKVPVTINQTNFSGDVITLTYGNLSSLRAPVSIVNTSTATMLLVDDTSGTTRQYTISSNKILATGVPTISWQGNPLGTLDVSLGGLPSNPTGGQNLVSISSIAGPTVGGTGRGTSVTIFSGAGQDSIAAGPDLDRMKGSLYVVGNAAHTTYFQVDDSQNHGAHTYTLDPSDVGRSPNSVPITFKSLGRLVVEGSTGTDSFKVSQPLSQATRIYGGSTGPSRLYGPGGTTNTWAITQSNAGTLTAGAAPALTFSGVQALSGGSGSDTFRFAQSGSVQSIDGGGGSDWLDYSQFDAAHPVTVDLSKGKATGTTSISKILDVIGGHGNDSLTGGPGGNILLGGPGNDTLVGGPNGNLLIGGKGTDTLTAGAFGDILIGGTTSYDANPVALQAILNEWRFDPGLRYLYLTWGLLNGKFGLNDGYVLTPNTVHDDAAVDTFNLSTYADWFFFHPGKTAADKKTGGNHAAETDI